MSAISYVDASAIVKLVLDEPETVQMRRWYIEGERALTSLIGILETRRAVARRDHHQAHLEHVIDTFETIELTEQILDLAASIRPTSVCTLDAIHLATALTMIPAVDAFVTYDDRLAEAARSLGLPVVSPA